LVINLTQAVKTAAVELSCPNGVAYSSLRWDGGSKYEPPACADRGKLGGKEKHNVPHKDRAGGPHKDRAGGPHKDRAGDPHKDRAGDHHVHKGDEG
jgi:hypothetical protein